MIHLNVPVFPFPKEAFVYIDISPKATLNLYFDSKKGWRYSIPKINIYSDIDYMEFNNCLYDSVALIVYDTMGSDFPNWEEIHEAFVEFYEGDLFEELTSKSWSVKGLMERFGE